MNMKAVKINDAIVADPSVCHGQPTFIGTRIMVWQILELLQEGETEQSIKAAYPSLPKDATKAALEYASQKIQDIRYVPFS